MPRTITCAGWNADGRFLATGSRKGLLQVQHFPDGRVVAQHSVKGPVESLACDPTGRFLAAGDGDHCLRVWAVREGMSVALEHTFPSQILSITFSPGGSRLSVVCRDHGVWVFALLEGGQPSRPLLGPVSLNRAHTGFNWVDGAGFLSDNQLVTSSGTEIKVWDLNAQMVQSRLPGGVYGESAVGVSAAGEYIVVSHWFQEPEFWWGGKSWPLRPLQAETVAVRPDGKQFLLGFKDGIQLWNRDRSPASGIVWHHGRTQPLAWSGNGRWFASAGGEGIIRIWRVNDHRPIRAILPVPKTTILPIVFAPSPGGDRVLTATQDQSQALFRVYRLSDRRADGPAVYQSGLPTGTAISPDDEVVYAITKSNAKGWLHAWKRASGKPVFPSVELSYEPYDLACRPDGGALAVAGGEGDVELRSSFTGELIRRQKSEGPYSETTFCADRIRFTRDGSSFITCGRQETIFKWDAHNGTLLQRFVLPPARRCVDARPSPDGRFLVSASLMAKEAIVWDQSTGKPAAPPLPHPDAVFTARFDASGDHVVTACRDGKARIWDWRRGKLKTPPLVQVEEVTDAAFSPDGRWVASAEAGGKARVWDARSGLPLAPGWLLQSPGQAPAYFVNRLEFSADGRYLLVGVRGQHLLVFDLTLLAKIASPELTPEDTVRLAEINAASVVQPGGIVEQLTSRPWLECWQAFRRRYPDYHAMPAVERMKSDGGQLKNSTDLGR
jgi:WD40 repeat protein